MIAYQEYIDGDWEHFFHDTTETATYNLRIYRDYTENHQYMEGTENKNECLYVKGITITVESEYPTLYWDKENDNYELQVSNWQQLDHALTDEDLKEYPYVRMMRDFKVNDLDDQFLDSAVVNKKFLDLNGHVFTTERPIPIGDGGELTIDDSMATNAQHTNGGGGIIYNNSSGEMFKFDNSDKQVGQSLIIKGGDFELSKENAGDLFSLASDLSGCVLNISGGKFYSFRDDSSIFFLYSDTNKGVAIVIENGAEFHSMSGSYIFDIFDTDDSKLVIKNATFDFSEGRIAPPMQQENDNDKLFDPHCIVYVNDGVRTDAKGINALRSLEKSTVKLIMKLNPDIDTVTLTPASFTYNGQAKTPTVTIDGLVENTDFTVRYENNTQPGSATAIITGIGQYVGVENATGDSELRKNFTISPCEHKNREYVVDKKASFAEAGSKHQVCTDCNTPMTSEEIPKATAALSATTGVYNGEAQTPTVSVTGAAASEYDLSWSGECKEVGEYTATITLKGDSYAGKTTLTYQITACEHKNLSEYIIDRKASFTGAGSKHQECKDCHTAMPAEEIPKATAALSATTGVYNGEAQTPTVSVTGAAASEYDLSWSGACKEVGEYTATITLKGDNYAGSTKLTYRITACEHKNLSEYIIDRKASFTGAGSKHQECKDCHTAMPAEEIPKATAALSATTGVYNGEAQTPTVTVTGAAATEYDLSWSGACKEVGEYTATITLKGDNYAGSTKLTYRITACEHKNLSEYIIDRKASFTEAGSKHQECKDCHTAMPAEEIPKATAALSAATGSYNDEVQTPTVTVTGAAATEYDLSWSGECKEVGEYTATITLKGDSYAGKTTLTYQITACEHKNLSEDYIIDKQASFMEAGSKHKVCTDCHAAMPAEEIPKAEAALSGTAYKYNGKVRKPAVNVTGAAAEEYDIAWSGECKNVGTYTAKITLKGAQYAGTETLTYRINPKGTSIRTPAAGKKSFTAKWKKQGSRMSKARITGYILQYATNKKFTSGKKSVKIKGYKKTYRKITTRKAKKTYYLRVRTYLTTGGRTYYSGWSKTKKVKTR